MDVTTSLTDADFQEARAIAVRVAGRYLPPDTGEAEDVAQSVLLKLLQTDIDAIRDWRAWVNRVARNLAIDRLRRWRHISTGPEVDPSAPPRNLIAAGPSARAMWPSIWLQLTKDLDDREREMLLASLDGASSADIARDFGYASANSAAVTLHRIRAKVRSSYADRQGVLRLLGVQRIY